MKSITLRFMDVICLVILTLFPSDSRSSPRDTSAKIEERQYWGNIGGGFASVPRGLGDNNGGVSGGMSLAYRKGGNLFSVRGIWNSELKLDLDLWGHSGPAEVVWDIGLLYGRFTKSKHGLASISAGVGIVGASYGGESLPLHAGIPVDIRLIWTPGSALGFGINGFADVNAYKSFFGLLFCVQLCREL